MIIASLPWFVAFWDNWSFVLASPFGSLYICNREKPDWAIGLRVYEYFRSKPW